MRAFIYFTPFLLPRSDNVAWFYFSSCFVQPSPRSGAAAATPRSGAGAFAKGQQVYSCVHLFCLQCTQNFGTRYSCAVSYLSAVVVSSGSPRALAPAARQALPVARRHPTKQPLLRQGILLFSCSTLTPFLFHRAVFILSFSCIFHMHLDLISLSGVQDGRGRRIAERLH